MYLPVIRNALHGGDNSGKENYTSLRKNAQMSGFPIQESRFSSTAAIASRP